jgi:Lrp/AsnC family transcriptional regulator, regulator for asnA, asnC and gidA
MSRHHRRGLPSFNDQEHLLQFVSSKLGALEGVTGAETSLILKVAKFSYEWEIP